MKSYIVGIDLEGIACVAGAPGQSLSGSKDYAFAAREAVFEANACARALFDSGADDVILWDNHGGGINLDYAALDPRCRIALGVGFKSRFPGITNDTTGVLFIGYHAREGTPNAVLAHTYSSVTYQSVKINGRELGEMEIDAAYAGMFGVKAIFTSTDEAAALQVKENMPWIESVAVKKGYGRNGVVSLSPAEAQKRIYEGTLNAVKRADEMRVFAFDGPIDVEYRFQRADAAYNAQFTDMNGEPFGFADPFTRTGRYRSIKDYFG